MSSIRTLSAELQEVARKELFEVTERIPEDLEALKVWINKQAHLTSRTGDFFFSFVFLKNN